MSPSIWQILVVLVLVLLFFGPKRISGLGTSLGEAIRGFKKGLKDDEIDVTPDSDKISKNEEDQQKQSSSQKQSQKEESITTGLHC